MAFNPPIHVLVNNLIDGFPSTQLSSSKYQELTNSKPISMRPSKLGKTLAYQEDFNYRTNSKNPGKLRNKSILLPNNVKSITTQAQLLELIKTRYAFLLKKKSDDTGYIIDLTSLNSIKMRSRYASLGCVIDVSKDLTEVKVTNTKDINQIEVFQIAELALALYNILKNLVLGIYNAVTTNLPFATRIQHVASSVDTAIDTTAQQAGLIATTVNSIQQSQGIAQTDPNAIVSTIQNIAANADIVNNGLNSTQKTLYPFQYGTPQFLDRVDKILLSNKGLLYHITGVDYNDMISFIQQDYNHELPFSSDKDSLLDDLPLKQLGLTYWNNIKIFINDCIEKQLIVLSELKEYIAQFNLPKEWSEIDSLTYILWQQFFNHTLIIDSALNTWKFVGSYVTTEGETIHKGTQDAINAFEKFFSLSSTKLVSCSDVITAPSLSRKFISLKQEMSKTDKYKNLQFLNPEHVSISLV